MKNFMIRETKNPNKPKIAMPTAETLATLVNSDFVGFFKANHTLLHFIANDFMLVNGFII